MLLEDPGTPIIPAVQELLDKQALAELVLRYCRGIDRRDYALVRSLYHDDAIDDHGHMFYGGADDYVAWLPSILNGFECTVHSLSNMLFRIDGDRAEGELYATAYHRTPPAPSREIVVGGRYLDQYSRRDGVWKFQHRALVLDWCRVAEADLAAYQDLSVGAPTGSAGESDPSYRLLKLFGRTG